jgi:hypothetical protein
MAEITMPDPTLDAIWAALGERAAGQGRTEGVGIPAHLLGSDCDLALYNTLHWVSAPEVRDGKSAARADQISLDKGFIIDALHSAGVAVDIASDDRGTPWAFELMDGVVRGRSDGIATGLLEAPVARHALMAKSLTAADFRGVKKKGLLAHKPDHWADLHAAMHGIGLERGVYVAVNREDRSLLLERIKPDHHAIAKSTARVAGIVAASGPPPGLTAGMTAAQMEGAAKRPPCLFCPHRGACFEALMPRTHCRTCVHFEFTARGHGHCTHLGIALTPLEQRAGATCPTHLHLPGLIPAEQIDADPERMTITYRFASGMEWTDGPAQGDAT